jgi:hypothetical protein
MKLIDAIRHEFADLERPLPDKIAARDENPLCLEALAVEKFFANYCWQDIRWETLEAYRGDRTACLYFMSPEAFLYFFPAYMIMTLLDIKADTGLLDQIVSLTYGRETDSRFFKLMQKSYDLRKKKCVGYFLMQVNERFVRSFGGDLDEPIVLQADELYPEESAFKYWLNAEFG